MGKITEHRPVVGSDWQKDVEADLKPKHRARLNDISPKTAKRYRALFGLTRPFGLTKHTKKQTLSKIRLLLDNAHRFKAKTTAKEVVTGLPAAPKKQDGIALFRGALHEYADAINKADHSIQRLKGILESNKRPLTKKERVEVKRIARRLQGYKRRCDLLRTAFKLLSKKGEPPAMLQKQVATVGDIKDLLAPCRKKPRKLFGQREALLALIGTFSEASTAIASDDWSDHFHCVSRKQFAASLLERVHDVEETLSLPTVNAKLFHEVRKDLRELYDWLRLRQKTGEAKTDAERSTRQRLASMNKVLGEVQDELAQADHRSEIDYKRFVFPMPEPLSENILLVCEAIKNSRACAV